MRIIVSLRSAFMRSSTRCGGRVGPSASTTRPSARNTTASACAGGDGVVGDHGDRLAELVDGACAGTPRISAPGTRVEVAGRLVGEDDVGPGRRARGPRRRAAAGRPTARPGGGRGGRRGRPWRRPRRATPRRAARPPSVNGRTMFSRAVSVGTRLNAWNTKPTRSRRSTRELLVGQRRRGRRRRCTTCPSVSVSRPAMQCSSVDLPEPDGPMIAVKRPGGSSTVTSSRARTPASPCRRPWWRRQRGRRRLRARSRVGHGRRLVMVLRSTGRSSVAASSCGRVTTRAYARRRRRRPPERRRVRPREYADDGTAGRRRGGGRIRTLSDASAATA